jgi:hypothetical protein
VSRGLLVRAVQVVVTTSLISLVLAWASRAAVRRRHLAGGTPGRRILAYPRWMVGLGLMCSGLFSGCAWFAWHAPPARGGPKVALLFCAFVLLGVMLVVGALADTFVVDDSGITRLRFGRPRRIAWGDLSRISTPWGGQGLRLASRSGVTLDIAEWVNGFGVLSDELLARAPPGLRLQPEASACMVRTSTLEPGPLQCAYARWFEAEEAEPPPALPPTELAVAVGRVFALRMLLCRGAFVPFEARWTASCGPRITHGEPRGEEPGYAALRLEGREVVIVTDEGVVRESLDG